MGRTAPTNSDDVIDSRDIIERIEELEADEEAAQEEGADPMDADDAEELKRLRAFADEAKGYASDWLHGATLIRSGYFETYAREMAEDIHGAAISAAHWPFNCIDWAEAAEELQGDYSAIDFDGTEYLTR